jgi:parallel beta-helix repeat protein
LSAAGMLAFTHTVSAATLCVNHSGNNGCYSSISAAVSAASAGDVINVKKGTYKEQVTITKSLSLIANDSSETTIDAKGLANGIFINGMGAAPQIGVSNVLVKGFTVRNANFEGILIANASDVTILENEVTQNNRSLDIASAACPGAPAFETNEGEDCGEGIHLMGAYNATIVRNEVAWNSGGILISDETGSSRDNLITENRVHDNQYDCGITLASHGPAVSVIPGAMLPYGVVRNTVSNNSSYRNGTQVPGAGAGIGIFAPFPGTTAAANVVIGNDVRDNGLPGITMHNHAYAPAPAPPVNLDDNMIVGNFLSGNAADTADAATGGTTGINVYSVAPIHGTLIVQNRFEDEQFDIVFKAPTGELSAHLNNFSQGIGVDNMGSGQVNATENWWNCRSGPGSGNCAGVSGPNVVTVPWASSPFGSSHDDENDHH